MQHPIFKITGLRIISDYKLELTFDDGLVKTINFEPVLHGSIYSPLRDLNLFNKVTLDKEISTIVWPNGADFEPSILHDWENYEEELISRLHSVV